MSAFVDTSAFYALLVRTERAHESVERSFSQLLRERRPLWTTSFVVVETMALLQHRLGLPAVRDFDEEVLPAVRVRWVDEALHRMGTDRLWREDRRGLSLVDCVSFELMRSEGISLAVAIDADFASAGFDVVP